MTETNNNFFIIKPHKQWLGLVLSIPFLILSLFFIVIYSLFIYFEKVYSMIPIVLLMIFVLVILFRNLLWIFLGKIEIEVTQTELNITKIIFFSTKSKSYYLNEIESISIKNLYFIRSFKNIPVLGNVYLSLFNFIKKDSESIVIKYRSKEIELLNHLTKEQAKSLENKLNNLLDPINKANQV